MHVKYLVIFALFCLVISQSTVAANEPVKIATGEFPPFTSASLPHHGFINHLISAAFNEVGIPVEFVYLPWSRAYQQSAAGIYPVSSYWYITEKHEKDFLFSDVIFENKLMFFKLKSNNMHQWRDLKDLAKLKIGLTRGYTYTPDLWDYAKQHQYGISVVETDLQNLGMLLLGRIDLFPGEEQVIKYLLATYYSADHVGQVEAVGPDIAHMKAAILFSKQSVASETLRNEFNRGLKIAIEKGIIGKMNESLLNGYYVADRQH